MCEDSLCETCFIAAHLRGRKRNHRFVELKEPMEPEEVACSRCSWRVGTAQCPDCYEALCDSCLAFEHKEECKAWLQLQETVKGVGQLACVVCGDVPDTECQECGDVYCSKRWAGNPGCFAKMHRRGNRKSHTSVPYNYVYELREQLEQTHIKVLAETQARVEEETVRVHALEATSRRVHEVLAKKQEMRQRRLEEEAQAEYQRKVAGKGTAATLLSSLARTWTGAGGP